MKRESRYYVLKYKDATAALTDSELLVLARIDKKVEAWRAKAGKHPFACAVVESDWPEYEPTWQAIERRVDREAGVPAGDGDPHPKWGFQKSRKKHTMETLYAWLSLQSSAQTVWELMREIRNKDICDLERLVTAIKNRESE